MTRKCGWFGLALLAQLALLTAVPWGRTGEGTGTTLWLRAMAMHRDDPMQGHYLKLDYEISAPACLDQAGDPGRGRSVFVVLQQVPDGTWEALRTEPELPSGIHSDQVAIRGTTTDRGMSVQVSLHENPDGSWEADSVLVGPRASRPPAGEHQTVARAWIKRTAIVYGIESYFVPKGERERLGEDLRSNPGEVAAQVRVDDRGRASLLRLRVQDRVYEF